MVHIDRISSPISGTGRPRTSAAHGRARQPQGTPRMLWRAVARAPLPMPAAAALPIPTLLRARRRMSAHRAPPPLSLPRACSSPPTPAPARAARPAPRLARPFARARARALALSRPIFQNGLHSAASGMRVPAGLPPRQHPPAGTKLGSGNWLGAREGNRTRTKEGCSALYRSIGRAAREDRQSERARGCHLAAFRRAFLTPMPTERRSTIDGELRRSSRQAYSVLCCISPSCSHNNAVFNAAVRGREPQKGAPFAHRARHQLGFRPVRARACASAGCVLTCVFFEVRAAPSARARAAGGRSRGATWATCSAPRCPPPDPLGLPAPLDQVLLGGEGAVRRGGVPQRHARAARGEGRQRRWR